MLLIFDLWHPLWWDCQGQLGRGSGVVAQVRYVSSNVTLCLAGVVNDSIHQVIWVFFFLVLFERYNQMTHFYQRGFSMYDKRHLFCYQRLLHFCCFLKIVSAVPQSLMWQFISCVHVRECDCVRLRCLVVWARRVLRGSAFCVHQT